MQRTTKRRTPMKKNENIDSLKALKMRKMRVARELNRCEDRLMDDYIAMTQPVTSLVNSVRNGEYEGDLPLDGMYKFALNAKRVVDMFRLGYSIYKDYRK